MEMVRKAHEMGYIVGSCSDRPISGQQAIWQRFAIPAAFTAAKHQLDGVKERIAADAYYHIGDRDLDKQFGARAHGQLRRHVRAGVDGVDRVGVHGGER